MRMTGFTSGWRGLRGSQKGPAGGWQKGFWPKTPFFWQNNCLNNSYFSELHICIFYKCVAQKGSDRMLASKFPEIISTTKKRSKIYDFCNGVNSPRLRRLFLVTKGKIILKVWCLQYAVARLCGGAMYGALVLAIFPPCCAISVLGCNKKWLFSLYIAKTARLQRTGF